MKSIKRVIVFDGKNIFENEQVFKHTEYNKLYGLGNSLYMMFIDEINNSNKAYLYIEIDNNGKPSYQIKDAPVKLLKKLNI